MVSQQQPKLMWRVRSKIRVLQYSFQTEKTYVHWIKKFIHYFHLRHPETMAEKEITSFLTHLAVNKKVSPSTQNQALYALLFLYKHLLEIELPEKAINAVRAKPQKNLPTVLSTSEVKTILNEMHGLPKLMAQVIYGTGLRKTEVHRLRVKDIDFDRNQITVKRGKGGKDRPLPLPQTCRVWIRYSYSPRAPRSY